MKRRLAKKVLLRAARDTHLPRLTTLRAAFVRYSIPDRLYLYPKAPLPLVLLRESRSRNNTRLGHTTVRYKTIYWTDWLGKLRHIAGKWTGYNVP